MKQDIKAVIKKYWRMFSKEVVITPVKDYVCEIDTGNAKPIAIKNANYGERESIIMDKHIAVLEENKELYYNLPVYYSSIEICTIRLPF